MEQVGGEKTFVANNTLRCFGSALNSISKRQRGRARRDNTNGKVFGVWGLPGKEDIGKGDLHEGLARQGESDDERSNHLVFVHCLEEARRGNQRAILPKFT